MSLIDVMTVSVISMTIDSMDPDLYANQDFQLDIISQIVLEHAVRRTSVDWVFDYYSVNGIVAGYRFRYQLVHLDEEPWCLNFSLVKVGQSRRKR